MKESELKQENKYITSIERIGIAQTLQKSIVKIIKTRFQDAPSELVEQINKIYDHDRLNQLLEQAITIGSVPDFQEILTQENTGTDS